MNCGEMLDLRRKERPRVQERASAVLSSALSTAFIVATIIHVSVLTYCHAVTFQAVTVRLFERVQALDDERSTT